MAFDFSEIFTMICHCKNKICVSTFFLQKSRRRVVESSSRLRRVMLCRCIVVSSCRRVVVSSCRRVVMSSCCLIVSCRHVVSS